MSNQRSDDKPTEKMKIVTPFALQLTADIVRVAGDHYELFHGLDEAREQVGEWAVGQFVREVSREEGSAIWRRFLAFQSGPGYGKMEFDNFIVATLASRGIIQVS